MHRPQAWFVTGTDTGVGKTFVCCALLHRAAQAGRSALAMKPVAAGLLANGCNEDVEQLIAAATVHAPRVDINPYLFAPAIAPHIAARQAGQRIAAAPILAAFDRLQPLAELLLVEGVGGFRVPLNDAYDSADLARDLGLPVILVVGLRLGCLNHALLSSEAIAARGLPLAGWVANRIDPDMAACEDNIAALGERLPAPLLGTLPHRADSLAAARHLRWPHEPPDQPPPAGAASSMMSTGV